MIVESDPKREYSAAIPINGYTVLKLGSSQVAIGIRNVSCQCVTIPAKTVIAKVTAANVVPHSYALKVESDAHLLKLCELNSKNISDDGRNTELEGTPGTPSLTPEKERLLFSKINLDSIKIWSDDLKCKTRQLFKEYMHIFALESLDIGHTSLVKHKIKLSIYTPFNERYR